MAKKKVGSVSLADNFSVLDYFPQPVIVCKGNNIHYANKPALRALSLAKKEIQEKKASLARFFSAVHIKELKSAAKEQKKNISVTMQSAKAKLVNISADCSIISYEKTEYFLFVIKPSVVIEKSLLHELTVSEDLRLILGSIDEVVYYVEHKKDAREIKYISDHVKAVIGLDPADYKKKAITLLDRVHPDDREQVISVAGKLRSEKKPQKYEYRIRHFLSDEYIWLEERVFPQLDGKGQLIGNFGVSRDITRERTFEQKLKESEKKFRLLAENANDIIYKCNYHPEIKYEYISPSVKRVLGYDPEMFYSNANFGLSIIHPEDAHLLDFRNETDLLEKQIQRTARYIHANGNLVWLETSYSFVSDEKGNIIAIQGISRDITKENESEAKIRKSEEKFRLLADNAHDIIFQYRLGDKPGYTYISPSVNHILGYTPEDFYADPYFGYKLLLSEDREESHYSSPGASLSYSDDVKEMTLRYKSKSGRVVWLQTSYSYSRDEKGIITEMQGISRDITPQKESELAMQESERKLNSLLSNMPGMAYRCLYDEQWTMLFASKGSLDLTGYSPEELTDNKHCSFARIVHPEDILIGRAEVANAIAMRTSFEIEYRIIHKSGEVKWVWEKGEGIYNSAGKLLFIEGFMSDISIRKKIEMELSQKWTNFQSLVETTPDGIFILQNNRIIYANPAALRIMDISSAEEINSKGLFDFIHPDFREYAKERIERFVTGENTEESFSEYKLLTARKRVIDAQIRTIPIIYNGHFALQLIFHDITSRKELEYQQLKTQLVEDANRKLQEEIAERLKVESELRHTQKFTRLLIDSSLDMICAADPEGKVIEFNSAAEKAFGYTFEEIKGKQVSCLYANIKDQHVIMNQLLDRGSYVGEAVNKRKNGDTFISYLSATLLRNENGEVIGSMGVSRDITKLKMDELQLRENEERYRAVYSQAFIGIARVDIFSGRFIEVNHRLCEMLGYSKHELLKKTTFELTAKEDRNSQDHGGNFSGDGFFIQRRYLHKNNSIVHMNLSYSLVKDVANNPLYFVVVYDDITKSKLYEQEILSQSSKLKAIFESSSHLVWTVNKEYELTSFNTNFAAVIRDKYQILPRLNKRLQEDLHLSEAVEYSKEWIPKYEAVFNGQILKFERTDWNNAGDVVYREVFLHPIYNERNEVVEISCIANDITERKNIERQITEQSAKLNAIFESTEHLIWTLNRDLELTAFNGNFSKEWSKLGVEVKIDLNMEAAMRKVLSSDASLFWLEKFNSCFNGNRLQFETVFESGNRKMYREIFLQPIFSKSGEVIEISGIAQDITERKSYERQITEQSAQLKAIFNSQSHTIWTVTRDFKITSYNDNFYKRVINNPQSFHKLIDGASSINMSSPNYELWISHYTKAFAGQSQHFETTATTIAGEEVCTEIFLEPIISPDGTVIEVSGIAHDTTEKKKAEEQLRLSLREKEVLLKEVHHRVKNNLQVISSILNLQSSYVKEQNTLMLLKECQNRIKSMAFIHESLYQNKDFSNINFSEYIVMLAKNLIQSYGLIENRVQLNLDVEPVALNLDMSIPCGLIVNEIISNALKYAFPGERAGEVFVQLKVKNGEVHLSIGDNGIGLPADLDFRNTESLGLQLVVTLVEQINGSIEVDRTCGTRFLIIFTFNNIGKN